MKDKSKVAKGATLIAANTRVTGDIHFDDQLFVNGEVAGDITADSSGKATLIISDEGKVKGEIRVPNIVINGHVEGNVYAGARIELAGQARVTGNVYYKLIEMQLGATVDGSLLHAEDLDNASKVHQLPVTGEADDEPESGAGAV